MTRDESEWKTRKKRIDPRLAGTGWVLPRGASRPDVGAFRTEEEETNNGPADYALWLDDRLVGVVEALAHTAPPASARSDARL